jgi:REP element-mobilizing transposase RayT
MAFNPLIHNRRYMRLRGWDYSSPGCYFVTICVKNKECFLADIVDGKIVLNEYGKIVESRLQWLKNQYRYVELDTFAVMPNHVHGLIKIIRNSVVTGRDLSLSDLSLPISEKIKSLSDIMGAFKTTSSKDIHLAGFPNFYWQRSFYEKIIRSEAEASKIRQYIRDNPANWDCDDENPGNKLNR